MTDNKIKFSIIYEELDRLLREPEFKSLGGESEEDEEIRILREIVMEMETPTQTYLTST